MSSPKEGLLIFLIEPGKDVSAVRLAPILLIYHVKARRSVSIDLRDLCSNITFRLWTICIFELLDCLAEDLDRMQI